MSNESIVDRVKAYIVNVEKAINYLKQVGIEDKYGKIIDIAESYLNDAKYYFDREDYFTALACIAYAEGLIDSLNHMGIVSIKWESLSKLIKRPRVLVAGAFEIIHPGHIYLLRKAWELGEVYVIVARDSSIEKFKNRKPVIPEDQRRIVIENIKYVSKAILGDSVDYFKPIIDLKPDIILLGPDQWIMPSDLKNELEKRGLKNTEVLKLNSRIDGELYSVSRIIEKIRKNN